MELYVAWLGRGGAQATGANASGMEQEEWRIGWDCADHESTAPEGTQGGPVAPEESSQGETEARGEGSENVRINDVATLTPEPVSRKSANVIYTPYPLARLEARLRAQRVLASSSVSEDSSELETGMEEPEEGGEVEDVEEDQVMQSPNDNDRSGGVGASDNEGGEGPNQGGEPGCGQPVGGTPRSFLEHQSRSRSPIRQNRRRTRGRHLRSLMR